MRSPARTVGAPVPVMDAPDPGLEGLSTGTRVAASVIALGYLLGLVPGSLAVVVGALALLTFGRSLATGSDRPYAGLAAFGVIALAAGVGALRWGSSSLDAIRGVQAVLGPSVLVEPEQVAVGMSLAAAGAVLALSVWLAAHRWAPIVPLAIGCAEGAVVVLLLATVYWGPAVVAPGAGDSLQLAQDVGGWVLVVLAGLVPAVSLSFAWRRLPPIWSWVALLAAGAAALAGTILVPGFVTS